MCQNSGLGNAVNPLTSLNFPFRIPTLLIVTWRGQPGIHDEPQHELMGQITAGMLDIMRIPHAMFPAEAAAIGPVLDVAVTEMKSRELPYALIMPHDTVRDTPPPPSALSPVRGTRLDLCRDGSRPSRDEILQRVIDGQAWPTDDRSVTSGEAVPVLPDQPAAVHAGAALNCAVRGERDGRFHSDEFTGNPVGILFDPTEVVLAYEAGVPEEKLTHRSQGKLRPRWAPRDKCKEVPS
jgi:hypothetical protein